MAGLMELGAKLYDPALDLFAPCRTKPLPAMASPKSLD